MYLLHVVNPCALDSTAYMPPEDVLGGFSTSSTSAMNDCTDMHQLLGICDARAKKLAREIVEQFGVPIYGKAEEHEDVVECVHDFCARHDVDLLVVGSRPHSIIGSLLLGSTAEKLVRAAGHLPITVVPCRGS